MAKAVEFVLFSEAANSHGGMDESWVAGELKPVGFGLSWDQVAYRTTGLGLRPSMRGVNCTGR